MKTVIAGGRDYQLTKEDTDWLDSIREKITLVIEGGAQGADRYARHWANLRNIPVHTMKAQWGRHGMSAGPIRNREMAKYAEQVILFPGGRGTANMRTTAKSLGLPIIDPPHLTQEFKLS